VAEATVQAEPAAAAADPISGGARRERHRDTSRLRWLAGYLTAAVVLFLCYLRTSEAMPITSDGASNALQAWDMLHGNLLLHGWTLSDVSFYTVEMPQYVLVEALRGLGPADVHICAAITYTLVVLLAGLLAKGTATGREGLIRVLIASGIMIAPNLGHGSFVLLLSPDHVGTGIPLLLAFLLFDRLPDRTFPVSGGTAPSVRKLWWVPPAVGLILVWAQVNDPLAVTVGVVPVVAVCVLRAYRAVVQRREPVREHWLTLAVGVAAAVSAGVADAVVRIIRSLGGYRLAPFHTAFAPSASWPAHVSQTADGILQLYGVNFTAGKLGPSVAVSAVHLVGVALAASAFCRVLRQFVTWPDPIAQILTAAIVVNVAAYIVSTLPTGSGYDSREIANVLAFGAVLAGRTLAARLAVARLLPALAVVACGYLLALGHGAVRAPAPVSDTALVRWLGAHHLTNGIGTYAQDNRIGVDSRGAVVMVAPQFGSHSAPRKDPLFEEQAADFDPRLHYANFVIFNARDGALIHLSPSRVIRAFGHPARIDHYGPWTIMTWNKNLLADIR
jgi:hypothetical protein